MTSVLGVDSANGWWTDGHQVETEWGVDSRLLQGALQQLTPSSDLLLSWGAE